MRTFTRRALLQFLTVSAARLAIGPASAQTEERDLSSFGATYGKGDAAAALIAAAKWSNASGGVIRVSGPAVLKSPVALVGDLRMRGSTSESALRGVPAFGQPLLQIAQGSVRLEGLRLSGSGEDLGRPVALVRGGRLKQLEIVNCRLGDHRAGLLALFGCANVALRNNTFENWGVRGPTKQGGPAVHLAALREADQPTHDVVVENNTFQNGEWVAISVYARDTKILNNKIHNVKESGLFAFRHRRGDPASDAAMRLEIVGNAIKGVTRKDVSATGLEVGADHVTIRDNDISETESSGVKILDTSLHASVLNNRIVGTVRRPDIFHNHGQIQVQSRSTTADAPVDVIVRHNVVSDNRKPATAPYAFASPQHDGWAPIQALIVENNDFRGGYSVAPVNVPPEERHYDFKELDNKG